jgi:hypothetical protein
MVSRCGRRIARGVLLAAATMLLLLPVRTAAQEPLPATLLRRLGSAVEGYRTGRPVWVVASLQFPHDVRGVYPALAEAMRNATLAGPSYRSFGPYFGTRDTTTDGAPVEAYGIVCVKQWDTRCLKDSTGTYATMENVARVIITLVSRAGDVQSDTLRPDQVEAVFFTMSALDKMLIPYYTQLYGSRYAARVREEYLSNLSARHR